MIIITSIICIACYIHVYIYIYIYITRALLRASGGGPSAPGGMG